MSHNMQLSISSVLVENLRGYTRTLLPLDRRSTVIVGRNNSGKTSVLRLLNWFLNDVQLRDLRDAWPLPQDVADFILPARDAKRQARRLTVKVALADKRSHRRFECINGVADLRLNVRLTPEPVAYLALGVPRRSEAAVSSSRALELFDRVQHGARLVYVPSFRDAGSQRFRGTLSRSLARRVESRTSHHTQGGAPAEYRHVRAALRSVKLTVERLAGALWPDVERQLPPGLAETGGIHFEGEVADLVEWATGRLTVRVSTGAHDAATVPLTDLGSGLQSLLDLAIQKSEMRGDENTILVVEEPESFLHPSAQRVITRSLLGNRSPGRMILTTHSAIVVDEARYGDVVICRNQKFYSPRERPRPEREEINSALLSGQGAEMLFARSVLLVEGESDRLFFEKMRRRLAEVDNSGRLDELFVVAVGGKRSFAQWIKVLDSYGTPADRPIDWLVVADGDAGGDVRRAFADAQVSLPQEVIDQIGAVGSNIHAGSGPWIEAIRTLNRVAIEAQARLLLLPVDLESAVLSMIGPTTVALVATKAGVHGTASVEGLLSHLGSKAVPHSDAPNKAPWLRGYIGSTIPWSECSPDIRQVVARWLSPVMPEADVDGLLGQAALPAG